MKLLFDEHLPRSMVRRTADLWPGSSHVLLCGLGSTDDAIIRAFAADRGFVIVTKDNDFYTSSIVHGAPPKVIWLRIGNCSVAQLENLLRLHAPTIAAFNDDPVTAILTLA
jgi:predicted nuclease of predicted toxin-antitoxin system